MIHAKLHLVHGDSALILLEFNAPAVLGRSKMADVTVPHPLISRSHCELTETDDGRLAVRDLDALNGTYVGEARIKRAVLNPGDLLTVGPFTYRVEYELAGVEDEVTEELPAARLPRGEGSGSAADQRVEDETGYAPAKQGPPPKEKRRDDTSSVDLGFPSDAAEANASAPIQVPDFVDPRTEPVSTDDEALKNFLKNLS